MSFDYDVAIVGAGPIGSTLAYQLSEENLKVCLIDKKKTVGLPLQCAGIINKRIASNNDLPEELILNKAYGANIFSRNHSMTVSKKEVQAYIIDRVAFDQYLFKKACDNGVDAHLACKVDHIDSSTGQISFSCSGEQKEIKSRIIVGADGPLSLVSSSIGNDSNYYNATQYLVKVEEIEDMGLVNLHTRGFLFPGFIWVIPVYKNIFRVGLFTSGDSKEQNKILDDFLESDFGYDDYEVLEKYKGRIPVHDKNKKLFKDRAIIIGDAAAQVKPTTGGGILLGSQAVPMASKAICNALKNDDLTLLSDYQKEFEDRFSSEFSYQLKVQKTLSTLSDDDIDFMILKLIEKDGEKLISEYGDMDNQSVLVKEMIKRGLIFSLLPAIHKKELAKIWLLD